MSACVPGKPHMRMHQQLGQYCGIASSLNSTTFSLIKTPGSSFMFNSFCGTRIIFVKHNSGFGLAPNFGGCPFRLRRDGTRLRGRTNSLLAPGSPWMPRPSSILERPMDSALRRRTWGTRRSGDDRLVCGAKKAEAGFHLRASHVDGGYTIQAPVGMDEAG